MSIRDLMTKGLAVVTPDDSIQTVARKMATADVGFIPVCDGDKLCGVVTDRDLAVRAIAEAKEPSTPVREIMSEEIVYCFDDEAAENVAIKMKEREVRRVLVVNRSKRLVGVVSLGDLATGQPGQSVDVLETVSEAPPNK